MAFRARKFFRAFEQRAQGDEMAIVRGFKICKNLKRNHLTCLQAGVV